MPDGYLVNLGNGSLDPGDPTAISPTSFTIAATLGTGTWQYDYTRFFGSGTATLGGTFHLATDGKVYFQSNGNVPVFRTITSAKVLVAPVDISGKLGISGHDRIGANGGGAITVIGSEDKQSDGDSVDFGRLLETGSIACSNSDDGAGELPGSASLADGTIANSPKIETIICFTAGTAIQTPMGERRIETLKPGDMVQTLDHGPRELRWIGSRTVPASGAFAPIRFARGSIGNHRDLLVSPQHRMLCGGSLTQQYFGEAEILAPAMSLVDDLCVTIEYGGVVTYVHMLFDEHEIVLANGAPSESFYPGNYGLDSFSDLSRNEIFDLFPELRSDLGAYGPTSRVCVKPSDARVLVAS